MEKPSWYLIQRLEHVERKYKSGVDAFLLHDYMGSAEFEWGAIPATWKALRLAGVADKLVISEIAFTEFDVNLCFHAVHSVDESVESIREHLYNLLTRNRSLTLKEPTYMDMWLLGDKVPDHRKNLRSWVRILRDNGRYYENDAVPVFWSLDLKMAQRVLTEVCLASKSDPVEPREKFADVPVRAKISACDLRLFDLVDYNGVVCQVRGIHDKQVDLKLPDGTRKPGVKYSEIAPVAQSI